MANKIAQGVEVVSVVETNEMSVGQAIQEKVSEAISKLNAQGKRVVNISSGPAINLFMGVNHLTYVLWESDDYQSTSSKAYSLPPSEMSPKASLKSPSNDKGYRIVITGYNGNRNLVIAKVRAIARCDFSQAASLISNLPAVVKVVDSEKAADAIKQQLEAAGAIIEINNN